jgi:uncharacterized lipoprotein
MPLLFAIATAACASYTPPAAPAPKPHTVHTRFAAAWPAAIAFIEAAKFPIDHLDKPEGLLETRGYELNRLDSVQWIDCGTAKFSPLDQPKSDSLVADLTVTITDMRDSVSVFVDLTAIANTLVLSGNSRHIVQHACRSNGRFERELLERLRATSP